ncbi:MULTISPECIES: transglutaminase-like domain-containing protein [unclassified Polaromonas]|uniref:transglutaminase-like domain-containing protein n=1 Tax=unclassified Polaromonas TaxID=2638319 RepID=UPI0018CB05C6|nr:MULTISPECIES: transglutaminase domain-containing protein [unclassified Polaromonas]MBG6071125.1 transglutaminase-like putative cysteine protease [Polaromonas sp. CG_9.7]MBG6113125.1 transglutaminase-like putative cysteine protease [Polaromonas sp. CG_9.2]MDH6185656.1 transglutaminase-like putative cysteine protease [Polaromonas sp. CG_23.6]
MTTLRRNFLKNTAVTALAASLPGLGFAQATFLASRALFAPQSGAWRTFEVTTRVDIAQLNGATRAWLPIPSVNSDYQRSLENSFSSNGAAKIMEVGQEGAMMLYVDFAAGEAKPFVELTSRVQTQNRATDWSQKTASTENADTLHYFTRATDLIPLDGIVRTTALEATKGAETDLQKVQQIYDWVVTNTYREPKVRGCGEGDIRTMLETGNLGGKCADLNAIFVGLCRAVGIPARDVYGIRLVPSAFGYKELSGNPASLKAAQHCRSEAYLKDYGWVAMDPADVAKVMRMETADWIKNTTSPVVAPVNKALFGGWEGNWMAYNTAHDVSLPNAKGSPLGFFMYPVAENAAGRFDSYAPDDFKYQITAREIKA